MNWFKEIQYKGNQWIVELIVEPATKDEPVYFGVKTTTMLDNYQVLWGEIECEDEADMLVEFHNFDNEVLDEIVDISNDIKGSMYN